MDSQWMETALKLGGNCDPRNIGSSELDLTLKLGPPSDDNYPSQFIGTEGTSNHGKVGDRIADAGKGTNQDCCCCCCTTSKQGGAIGLSPKIGTYFRDPSRYMISNGPVLMGIPAAYPSYPAFNGFHPPAAGSSQLLIVPPTPIINGYDHNAGMARKVVGLESKKSRKRGSSPRNDTIDLSRRCMNNYCNTYDTPMWRKGPLGPKTLCNACGIKYRKEEERRRIRSEAAAAINNKINRQSGSMQG